MSTPSRRFKPSSLAQSGPLTPQLKGVSGPYAGAVIELDDQPLVIGRDPQVSQLVFPATATNVGRQHCILSFDTQHRQFLLEDCSSLNGTFLEDGTRLKPGKPHRLRAGMRFYVGHADHVFEVQL